MNVRAQPLMSLSAVVVAEDEYLRLALKTILTDRLDVAATTELGRTDRIDAALAHCGRVDLALVVDGDLAALRALRARFPDMRIVAVMSAPERREVLAAIEAGMNGVVPRALPVGELARGLRLVLEDLIFVPPTVLRGGGATAPAADAQPETPRLPAIAEADGPKTAPHLTPRQRDVLELIVQGWSNKEIARWLDLGPGTVKCHLSALMRNLGVRNRSAAAVVGARLLGQPGDEATDCACRYEPSSSATGSARPAAAPEAASLLCSSER